MIQCAGPVAVFAPLGTVFDQRSLRIAHFIKGIIKTGLQDRGHQALGY